jgi:hypothetical protein
MNIPVSPASVNNNHSGAIEVCPLPSETTALLKLGCKLFPCKPDTKLPAITGWQDAATSDPDQLREWIAQGYILGIYCAGSRFLGVDLDLKNDPQAWEWCHTWLSAAGLTAEALKQPLQFSRSGSPHFAFRVPDDWVPAEHGGLRTFKISDFRALKPGEKNVEIFSVRNRGLLIAAGSVVDGKRYTLPAVPTVHPWLPALGDALGHRSTIEAPTHDAEAGLKNCTVEEVSRAIDVLLPTGAFDVEEYWARAIWQIKRSLGVAGWPLVEKISYSDGQDLRLVKWNNERASVADPYGAATIIKDAARVLKAAGLSDPIVAAAEQRYNGAVRTQQEAGMFNGAAAIATLAGSPGMPSAPVVASPPLQPGQAPPAALPTPPVPPTTEEIEAERVAALDALPAMFQSETEFTHGFVPPDYLLDGVYQCGFLYSVTAQTGGGKTAMMLRLVAHIATEQPFCGLDVKKGEVLYMAGENPDDVKMRWMALKREMGITERLGVHFTSGSKKLTEIVPQLEREIIKKEMKPILIVVDTAAAHFSGESENDNDENGAFARQLRTLSLLPGNPTVIVLCHPTKNAKTMDEMAPRGGGAFVAEVDGNGGIVNNDGTITLAKVVKHRGPEFPPLNLALRVVRDHPLLIDSRGRPIPTVVAVPISYGEVRRRFPVCPGTLESVTR